MPRASGPGRSPTLHGGEDARCSCTTTMAVLYGNRLGNIFQPFGSLPLLDLMGLLARDIMGLCLRLLVVWSSHPLFL